MTKQMVTTLILIIIAVVVAASEAQQGHYGNAVILAAVECGLIAVFFRQQHVFARRAVRATK